MPEYLVVQIRKFNYSASWVPTKIDVLIDAPDQIDLEKLRGKGLQEGEVVMKDEPAPAAAAPQVPLFNEEVVQMLMMMDIPRVRAERASHNTMGQDADAAVGWLFSHLDDPSTYMLNLFNHTSAKFVESLPNFGAWRLLQISTLLFSNPPEM
jgi:ubiquitin carboxyl-terminal hydrolase 5/13